MTPFMTAVQSVLDGAPSPRPGIATSVERGVAEAAHVQFAIRALAEQYVSEANVVLRRTGDGIDLRDEVGAGRLAFTIAYRDRAARIHTEIHGRTAIAELSLPGEWDGVEARELTSEDELQSLVLTLLS